MALICSFSSRAGLHAALTLPEVHPRHPSHAVSERSTPRGALVVWIQLCSHPQSPAEALCGCFLSGFNKKNLKERSRQHSSTAPSDWNSRHPSHHAEH